MTQQISSLVYNSINPKTNSSVANIVLDPAIDLEWAVSLTGNIQGTPENVVPKYISVDNIRNGKSVTFQLANFVYSVPPFTRETQIEIPEGVQSVKFLMDVGSNIAVNVAISETPIAQNQSNQLLIQQTAVATLIYSFVTYSISSAQLVSDLNKTVRFTGMGGAVAYQLLPISGTPVPNGWFQYFRNDGLFPVNLQPSGGDVINGFIAGAARIVPPGYAVTLQSDGIQWYVEDDPQENAVIGIAASSVQSLQHGRNSLILFVPAANIDYTLMPALGAGVGQGWTQRLQNLSAFTVTIRPVGADNIQNGVWNSANPLVLNPGDSITLNNAGGPVWWITGTITSISTNIVIVNNAITTVNHNLGKKPNIVRQTLICVNASNGWVPGDVVYGAFQGDGGNGNNANVWELPSATQLIYHQVFTATGGSLLPTKAGGASFQANNPNWAIRLEMVAEW